jgi:2-polyprenyl-3-methyl-5-hydroxy-6-metoxy-1,4-benzoquinol methylase
MKGFGLGLTGKAATLLTRGRLLAARTSRAARSPRCPACGSRDWSTPWSDSGRWVERCAFCGMGVTHPRPSATGAADHHRREYSHAVYVDDYLRGYAPYLTRAYQRGLAKIRAADERASRLLDVGCGFGYFLDLARSHGYEVHGVEVTPVLAVEARRRYGIDVWPTALHDAPAECEVYDVVTAWDVLEHCPDPHAAIADIVLRLKPGGIVLAQVLDYSFMSRGLPADFLSRYVDRMYPMSPDEHAVHYTPEAMAMLLESHGADVIDGWHSTQAESPPRELPDSEALLRKMAELHVRREFTLLARKS